MAASDDSKCVVCLDPAGTDLGVGKSTITAMDVLDCLGFKDDMSTMLTRLNIKMTFCDNHAYPINMMMTWLPTVRRFMEMQTELMDSFNGSCNEARGGGQELVTRMMLATIKREVVEEEEEGVGVQAGNAEAQRRNAEARGRNVSAERVHVGTQVSKKKKIQVVDAGSQTVEQERLNVGVQVGAELADVGVQVEPVEEQDVRVQEVFVNVEDEVSTLNERNNVLPILSSRPSERKKRRPSRLDDFETQTSQRKQSVGKRRRVETSPSIISHEPRNAARGRSRRRKSFGLQKKRNLAKVSTPVTIGIANVGRSREIFATPMQRKVSSPSIMMTRSKSRSRRSNRIKAKAVNSSMQV